MKIKIALMAVLIPAILFGGILAAIASNVWTTTSDKKPATYSDGSNAGEYNPADIRGSYTFAEISELFGIDIDILYKAFNISEGTDGTTVQTKDLESLFGANSGIGNESVQVFVAFYKRLPIDPGDTILPEQATAILLETGNLTTDQQNYMKEHSYAAGTEASVADETTPSLTNPAQPTKSGGASAEKSDGTDEELLVKGSTTFQHILDAGITQEQIESIIGNEMPPTNQSVKDYCNSAGLSFTAIKDQLNTLAK